MATSIDQLNRFYVPLHLEPHVRLGRTACSRGTTRWLDHPAQCTIDTEVQRRLTRQLPPNARMEPLEAGTRRSKTPGQRAQLSRRSVDGNRLGAADITVKRQDDELTFVATAE